MIGRAIWNTQTGFLLAAIGSAIGLGNIWRFPYMAYRNGGGAFLIPYFVALFVVGIPLLMVEFGLGHYFRRALPQALGKIHPRLTWIGWWAVSFVMFGIVVYYAVVIAWCGNYLVFSAAPPWNTPAQAGTYFSDEFLQYSDFEFYVENPKDGGRPGLRLGKFHWPILFALAVVWIVNWFITQRELQRGVELANKIFIPLLLVLTTILVVWSWGLEGAADGRSLYLTPDWDQAFQPQTWIDAFSQIFFTLSLGFGIMVAYASYLPRKTDIPKSAFVAAMGDCLFGVFAAFAVFSAVGFLAHRHDVQLTGIGQIKTEIAQLDALRAAPAGLDAEQEARYAELNNIVSENEQFTNQLSTFGLVFKTYPVIITEMGPAGRVFGLFFFLSLMVAGITSSISIVEAFIAAVSDEFGWPRRAVSTVLCLIAFVLGFVFCTQSGLFWLDLVDHFLTQYGLVLVAIAEAMIVGWMFTARRLRRHLDEYRDFRFGNALTVAMRILITLVLLLTWYGLSRMEEAAVAGAIGRFVLLASAVVVWLDEHWLDFDVRLLIPASLILLLDRALLAEMQLNYGGYPPEAILGIGVGWLAGTLVIALGLTALARWNPWKQPAENNDQPEPNNNDDAAD